MKINEHQKLIFEAIFWLEKDKDFRGLSITEIYEQCFKLSKSDDVKNSHRSSISRILRQLKKEKLVYQGGLFFTEKGRAMASELFGKATNVPQEIKEDIPPAENEKKKKEMRETVGAEMKDTA